MATTRAQENRAIRQKELRAKLSAGGHIEQVIETIGKLDKPEGLTSTEVSALKASADLRFKLIDKYLPALKPVDENESTDEVVKVYRWKKPSE